MLKNRSSFTTLWLVSILFFAQSVCAKEGMWVPSMLSKLVFEDMQASGLKLSAEDIYNLNEASLKDAIVLFGGGCTAEIISKQGLILTNHHCGYSAIQALSSLEANYLENGFWADSFEGELPSPGLTATLIVAIEDVTEVVLNGAQNLKGDAFSARISENTQALLASRQQAGLRYEIKPLFYGNQYILVVTRTFQDVRLVGTPPSSIGKFGGDTDNWVWPRHTGDFSVFRIYASPNNEPAAYSAENVPYKPAHSLPINMNGIQTGDFTMVYGFPGSTQRYVTAAHLSFIQNEQTPVSLEMRTQSLAVIDAAMRSSSELKLKYAARQSSISNAYKKWQGQQLGLERFNVLEYKKTLERKFRAKATAVGNKQAIAALDSLNALQDAYNKGYLSWTYFIEYFYYGPELFNFASSAQSLLAACDTLSEADLKTQVDAFLAKAQKHFKDYDVDVDRKVAVNLTPLYLKQPNLQAVPQDLQGIDQAGLDRLYERSVFSSEEKLREALSSAKVSRLKKLENDLAYRVGIELVRKRDELIRPALLPLLRLHEEQMRTYMAALMELIPEEVGSPDANSTLRLTYGKAEGSVPRDGIAYSTFTTLDGLMEKYIPGHPEFDVPARLIELHAQRDYGKYATNGEMRVCFLGSNHTTGGNSGSPALDAHGNLVGLNFDRTWESTMSDLQFREEICRNIMVDIKYVLFIIDKFAGATRLIDEMELVYPEENSQNEEPQPELLESEG